MYVLKANDYICAVDDIENKRTGALRQIMTHLYQVRDSLRIGQDGYGCCRDCSSTLHETFVKALDNVALAGLSLETFGHGSVVYDMSETRC